MQQEPQQVGQMRIFQTTRSWYLPSEIAACGKDLAGLLAGLAVFAFIAIAPVFSAVAQVNETISEPDDVPLRSGPVKPAENPSGPRRHFRANDPPRLSMDEAERIYAELKEDMAQRYQLSRQPGIANYQRWKRYNRVPYRSTSHGRRFINNYANETASAYGRFEKAGRLPVGSVIAKDSFTVSKSGVVEPGPLFMMEKMPDGFSYVSGNWRYTMIMPDGSVFGITKGDGAERVEFCISCHLAVERQDHLFLIPTRYRRN